MARVILPKKKKKASEEEPEDERVIVSYKPRLERVGDNLFVWRVPVYKGEKRG